MKTMQRGGIADQHRGVPFVRGVIGAFGYLTDSERRWMIVLLFSTLINALLGLFGIASILPFFQLMVDPDPLNSSGLLGRTLRFVGVDTEVGALALTGSVVVVLVTLKNVYALVHARLVNRFSSRIETRVAADTLQRIVQGPFIWYIRQNTSVLRDVVMSHVIEWSRGVIRPALNLANGLLMLLTGIALVVPLTPGIPLAAAALVVVIGAGLTRLARPKVELAGQRKRRGGLLAGVAASEAITGGRDVRMSPAGQVLVREFRRHYGSYSYADADARTWSSVPRLAIEVVAIFALIAIAVGAVASGMGRAEAATVLALFGLVAVRLVPVVGDVANSISSIQGSLPQLTQLHALVHVLRDVSPQSEADDRFKGWSELTLSDVTFCYDKGGRPALDSVDLCIEKGRSYGLVGYSGAGKSTLVDIVAGLLTPTSGALIVDGEVVDEQARAAWRTRVSYVAQNPVIFDATIDDNIALSAASGEDQKQRLATAIKTAGLDSVISAFANSGETFIGDRGVRLSGGQRQRVAIARAIFLNSELLILDEATSALDSLTEREVTDAIAALKGRMTVLAVAHRLSTIMRCDEIVVLEQGRIVGRGTHEELLATSETYRRFVAAQLVGEGSSAVSSNELAVELHS